MKPSFYIDEEDTVLIQGKDLVPGDVLVYTYMEDPYRDEVIRVTTDGRWVNYWVNYTDIRTGERSYLEFQRAIKPLDWILVEL